MIDIGGKNGTAGGYLIPHELGRDMRLNAQFCAIHILADGYILHLRRNDALLGVIHLRATFSLFSPVGQGDMLKTKMVEALVIAAHNTVLGSNGGQLLYISALRNPGFPHPG